MQKLKTISAASLVLMFAVELTGCAIFPQCSPENCASDKEINGQVKQLFGEHPELGAPAALHIQTINGVVYLSGPVDSEFEVRHAEALARQIPNVKDVENNLYPRSNGR
jgi:osmotically-inducible protein OsmY